MSSVNVLKNFISISAKQKQYPLEDQVNNSFEKCQAQS